MSFNFNALSKKLQDVATQTSSRVNETINSIDFKQIQETTTNTFDKTTRLFEEKTNMKNIDITQYPQEYTQAVNKFKHYEQVINKSLNFTSIVDYNDYDINYHLSQSLTNYDKFNPIHDLISKVEDNRITYDIQRSKVLDYTKKNNSTTIDQDKLEEIRNKMNLDEDVFANSIENCILEINKLFEELNLLDYFKKLVKAELDYHKNSVKLLESFDF
ncbi:hypothetical protein FOG48_02817 [Hanseniaspora uvarum]|nr:hypothetical protein FOG48_02817 [Hanseniaspora uvarum]